MLFLLACLAKEVALVFPVLVVVWEAGRAEPRPGGKRQVVEYALLAIAIAAALLASGRYRWLLGYSLDYRPLLDNLLANGRAVPQMLSLWFRPWALSADHAFDPGHHSLASVAGLLALATVSLLVIAMRRRARLAVLAWLWPLVALLPTNSLVPKIDLVTEKPLYLAWVGPAIAIGYGVSVLLSAPWVRVHRRSVMAAGIVLIGLCAAACAWRVSVWSDPVALWREAVASAPEKPRCWNNLGMAYFAAGRYVEALRAFQTALRLNPTYELAAENLFRVELLCGRDCGIGQIPQ
jgi:tetratricopeptide (TPR) repeat protein